MIKKCIFEPCNKESFCRNYCRLHYARYNKHGDPSITLKGGRKSKGDYFDKNGYVMTIAPDWIKEAYKKEGKRRDTLPKHRVVMMEHLGRLLTPEETVHHINGNKKNNDLDNLELWSSRHPKGQKVTDLIDYAKGILKMYSPNTIVSQ